VLACGPLVADIVVRVRRESLRKLVETVGADRLHAVEGDYVAELEALCEIKGITGHGIEP